MHEFNKNIKIYKYLHARGGLAAGDAAAQGDDGVADGGEPHHHGDEGVHYPRHQPLHKPVNNQLKIK